MLKETFLEDGKGPASQEEEMEKRLSLPDVSLEIPLYDYGEETLADLVRSDENVEDEVAGREKKEILERKVAEFRQALTDKELLHLQLPHHVRGADHSAADRPPVSHLQGKGASDRAQSAEKVRRLLRNGAAAARPVRCSLVKISRLPRRRVHIPKTSV